MVGTLKKATFAGGCFWCMQPPFKSLEGVVSAVAGYSGGSTENPTYKEVSTGTTGYLESVQITYDTEKISYEKLLENFWMQIDPTDTQGQFADKGSQYHTAIFYHDDEQKRLAEESKNRLNSSKKFSEPIATEIRPYVNFYPAEDYHQDYYKKKPLEYETYKTLSGRKEFIEKTWGQPSGVTVYTVPGCNNCNMAKEYLKSRKVEFVEISITEHEDAAEMIVEKTGQFGVPVIQAGDELLVGYDEKKIDELLTRHMPLKK